MQASAISGPPPLMQQGSMGMIQQPGMMNPQAGGMYGYVQPQSFSGSQSFNGPQYQPSGAMSPVPGGGGVGPGYPQSGMPATGPAPGMYMPYPGAPTASVQPIGASAGVAPQGYPQQQQQQQQQQQSGYAGYPSQQPMAGYGSPYQPAGAMGPQAAQSMLVPVPMAGTGLPAAAMVAPATGGALFAPGPADGLAGAAGPLRPASSTTSNAGSTSGGGGSSSGTAAASGTMALAAAQSAADADRIAQLQRINGDLMTQLALREKKIQELEERTSKGRLQQQLQGYLEQLRAHQVREF